MRRPCSGGPGQRGHEPWLRSNRPINCLQTQVPRDGGRIAALSIPWRAGSAIHPNTCGYPSAGIHLLACKSSADLTGCFARAAGEVGAGSTTCSLS